MPKAARALDPIGHAPVVSSLLKGLLVGAAIALVAVAVIGTGGLAALALVGAGAAAGAAIGTAISGMTGGTEVCGNIVAPCSTNVFINGKGAARANIDAAICSRHSSGPYRIASGSGTVYINGQPAARVSDTIACSAVITDGSSNVFIGGGMSAPPHPILKTSDNDVIKGTMFPVDYASAFIDEENKEIHLEILMDYAVPNIGSRAVGLTSKVTPEEFESYVKLANAGLEKHWSRPLMLNGIEYKMKVTGKMSSDGMPMTLAKPGLPIWEDQSSRSRNPHPVLSGNLYRLPLQSEAKYGAVAAHEIGHGFLSDAFGVNYSWTHEGTSSIDGEVKPNAPIIPATGPVPLMPYSNKNPRATSVIERTIASEEDTRTILALASRRNK